MLMDFDADFTPRSAASAAPAAAPAVQVAPVQIVQEVRVQADPSQSTAYLMRPAEQWSWSDLRDYVVHQIEERFGLWPRDTKREFGIFSRFAKEHGQMAGPIARYAFEQADGMWAGAPISVNRFCKGSDEFFAIPIKARISTDTQVTAGW